MKYRIEFECITFTPVTVEAESQVEAIECALRGEGEVGDSWQEEPKALRIEKLEG